MCHAFLQPGRAYSFDYPRHNYRQLPTTSEPRKIVVRSVRDTLADPLDQVTATLNPLLKRGRWLITGIDLDKELERSFYVESMGNIQTISDNDLQTLRGVDYLVAEQERIVFKTLRLDEALAYRAKRGSGVVCAVLFRKPREIDLDSIEIWDFADDAA